MYSYLLHFAWYVSENTHRIFYISILGLISLYAIFQQPEKREKKKDQCINVYVYRKQAI